MSNTVQIKQIHPGMSVAEAMQAYEVTRDLVLSPTEWRTISMTMRDRRVPTDAEVKEAERLDREACEGMTIEQMDKVFELHLEFPHASMHELCGYVKRGS